MWTTYISLEFLSVWRNYGVFRNKNSKHVTSQRVYFNLSFSYIIFLSKILFYFFRRTKQTSELQIASRWIHFKLRLCADADERNGALCMRTVVRRNSRNSAVVVLQLDPPSIEIFIPSSHCKCQWWYTVLRHSERSASMFQHKRACGCINARCSQFMRCICVFPHMACYNLVGLHPYHVNWMHHMQTEIHQSKHR